MSNMIISTLRHRIVVEESAPSGVIARTSFRITVTFDCQGLQEETYVSSVQSVRSLIRGYLDVMDGDKRTDYAKAWLALFPLTR